MGRAGNTSAPDNYRQITVQLIPAEAQRDRGGSKTTRKKTRLMGRGEPIVALATDHGQTYCSVSIS